MHLYGSRIEPTSYPPKLSPSLIGQDTQMTSIALTTWNPLNEEDMYMMYVHMDAYVNAKILNPNLIYVN